MIRRILGRNRGGGELEPNLIIGGGAVNITSKSILSEKLFLPEANILSFEIVGSEVRAIVDANYSFEGSTYFRNDSNITFFNDVGGFCIALNCSGLFQSCSNLHSVNFPNATFVGNYNFRICTKLTEVKMPNLQTLSNRGVFQNCSILQDLDFPELINISGGGSTDASFVGTSLTRLNIPKCTALGLDSGYNQVFYNIPTGCEIIAPISLQTANAGTEEGDIAYARNTRGCTITYV